MLITLSIILLMSVVRSGPDVSKQGFELASIKHGLKSSLSMKSRPNNCIKFLCYLETKLEIIDIEFGVDSLDKLFGYFLHF